MHLNGAILVKIELVFKKLRCILFIYEWTKNYILCQFMKIYLIKSTNSNTKFLFYLLTCDVSYCRYLHDD